MIGTLRGLLFLFGLTVSVIVALPFVMLLPLLPLSWRFHLIHPWPRFVLWWLKVCCGLRFRVEGREHIPSDPGFIIFAKHSSTFETFALYALFPKACFVAKKQLLRIPIFGWGMQGLRYITIERGRGRDTINLMCQQAVDRLQEGLNIVIFPEGTRRAVGDPPQYKIGGAVMAARTAADVLPMAHNAGLYWPRHSLTKYPGEITIRFLPVIRSSGKKPEQLLSDIQQAIETAQRELGA